ncbi:hypothetical protein HGRIS_000187 [Hohenbuehelia grisea]|uniref:Uncharacterized protein n=1 Tax=Hohenbuehelia grisea TaxID=104357 RepID=A0ABR3JQY2_9AGAR
MKIFAFSLTVLLALLFSRPTKVYAAKLIVDPGTHAQVALNSLQLCSSGLMDIIFDLGEKGSLLGSQAAARVLAARIEAAEGRISMLARMVAHLGPMGTEKYTRQSSTSISSVLRGADNLSIGLRQIHGTLQKAGNTKHMHGSLLKLKTATNNYLGALMVYLHSDGAIIIRAKERLNASMDAVIQTYST